MNNIQLSDEQKKAIEKVEGATLLLAVPGSGKTTALIARLGHMINDMHIPPENILVITFTNNAAEDMQKRFSSLFGSENKDRITFRTINSFCYSVVKKYAEVSKHLKPKDDFDLEKNVRELFPKVYGEKYPEENEVRNLAQQITYIKNKMLTDDEISKIKVNDRDVKCLYDAYNIFMNSKGRMDYDDQILFTRNIFKNNHEELLDYYSDKYKYVLVDEAQDTSRLQHEVISLLVQKNGNLFMVGDEDQSIYGFRAAYPEALIRFKEKYPEGDVFYLQTNYRSTKNIVAVASNIIVQNRMRHAKIMTAHRQSSGIAKIIRLDARKDQYRYIIDKIKKDADDKEAAILYRNNDSALPFISLLEREGIPYNIKKMDTLFFSDKAVKDAIDIMSFAFNQASLRIMWRIYFKFGLRIRKKVLYDATQSLDRKLDSPIITALYYWPGMSKNNKEKLSDFAKQLDFIKNNNKAKDAIRRIRTQMEYVNASSNKLFILEAMADEEETVEDFLGRLRKMEYMLPKKKYDPEAKVVLSTIHGSKGLEYEKVYLVDAIEDILPGTDNDIEEERRIFYVGITRAEDELYICTYKDCKSPLLEQRAKTKVANYNRQSENRITNKKQTEPRKKTFISKSGNAIKTISNSQAKDVVKTEKPSMPRPPAAANKNNIQTGQIKSGQIIQHNQFGRGEILEVNGDVITVNFFKKGVKTLVLSLCIANGYIK